MIETFYSNSYEVLRQVLFENIGTHRKNNDSSAAGAFSPIDVVIPSDAVKDDLMRQIASTLGICAGIHVCSIVSTLCEHLSVLKGLSHD